MAATGQGEQRRALIIAGGGLVLVAALLIGSRLLGGGDGVEEAPPITTTTGAPGADEPEPVAPEQGDLLIPELPDTIEIVELRDPFFPPPLVGVLDQLDGGAPPGDGDGTEPPPGDGDGAEPPPGDGDGDDGAQPRERIDVIEVGEEEDDDGRFALLEVDGDEGEPARVQEGDVFGPSGEFQVVEIDPEAGCVLVLFGDEPFTVCVGETPQK